MTLAALKTVAGNPDSNASHNNSSLAGYLKAAGDPLRLNILKVLQYTAYSVLELCQLFDIRQSGMSHHLKVLSKAGLVSTRREGNTIFYRRSPVSANEQLAELHRELFLTIDRLELESCVTAQIEHINQVRTETSRQFFEQNSTNFAENQDLIASFQDYGDSIIEILSKSVEPGGTALEIGPGQGELLPALSSRFDQVYAVDNAEQMLALSRQAIEHHKLSNVEFLLADITGDSLQIPAVDCITLNMVLHHIPQPFQVLRNIRELLRPEGILLITELCEHQQDWVRESCGDLWQGFATEDLYNWATDAGFFQEQSLFLALRNGFNIQISIFRTHETH